MCICMFEYIHEGSKESGLKKTLITKEKLTIRGRCWQSQNQRKLRCWVFTVEILDEDV